MNVEGIEWYILIEILHTLIVDLIIYILGKNVYASKMGIVF